jgi:hypothetical protein
MQALTVRSASRLQFTKSRANQPYLHVLQPVLKINDAVETEFMVA